MNVARVDCSAGPLDNGDEVFYPAVVSSRSSKSSAIHFVYQAHIDHLHNVLQDHGLDDHALARNDFDHFFQHQPIDAPRIGARPNPSRAETDASLMHSPGLNSQVMIRCLTPHRPHRAVTGVAIGVAK